MVLVVIFIILWQMIIQGSVLNEHILQSHSIAEFVWMSVLPKNPVKRYSKVAIRSMQVWGISYVLNVDYGNLFNIKKIKENTNSRDDLQRKRGVFSLQTTALHNVITLQIFCPTFCVFHTVLRTKSDTSLTQSRASVLLSGNTRDW